MAEDFNIGRMKAEAIAKAFGVDLEKAHNVGDIHPNGKWVWTQLPSGKFDWRVRKQSSGEQGGSGKSTSSADSDSKKQEQGSLEAHAQNASDEALKRASQDPNAAPEVKAAAEAEIKKRGVSEDKDEGDKFISAFGVKRVNDDESHPIYEKVDKNGNKWRIKVNNSHEDEEPYVNISVIPKGSRKEKWGIGAYGIEDAIESFSRSYPRLVEDKVEDKKMQGENTFGNIKTVAEAEKKLVGRFVKINGKEAKIIGADKSKYDGEIYIKVVAGDDFLNKMKTVTLKELDAGKTSSSYKDNFWGKKDEELSVEVLDKEPQKEVVTKESLNDFIGFLNRNIKNKDSDEVINAEYKFLSTVPRKYLSSESNIHNRVVSTIKKLMTELK